MPVKTKKAKKKTSGPKQVAKVVRAVQAAPAASSSDMVRLESKLNSLLKQKTSGMLGTAGAALGSLVGAPGAGRMAGDFLGRVFGMGDYHVEVNSLVHPGSEVPILKDEVPQFGKGPASEDVVRVRHREYVGLLYSGSTLVGGGTLFSQQRYRLNPGNPNLLPYTSGSVALGFKEYLIVGGIIELRPLASEVSTSATLGSMLVSIDYDSTDPPYATKQQALESDGAVSGKPTEELVFGIECDPSNRPTPWLYNRFAPVSSSLTQSVNQYDLGLITVGTEGMPVANTAVAEIWFSYDILFSKKLMLGGLIGQGVTTLEALSIGGVACTSANPMSLSAPLFNQWGTGSPITLTGSSVNLPVTGVFLIYVSWTNGATAVSQSNGFVPACFVNCTEVGGAGTPAANPGGISGTYFLSVVVQAQGSVTAPASFNLNPMGWTFPSTNNVSCIVTQLGQQPQFAPSNLSFPPVLITNTVPVSLGWS